MNNNNNLNYVLCAHSNINSICSCKYYIVNDANPLFIEQDQLKFSKHLLENYLRGFKTTFSNNLL